MGEKVEGDAGDNFHLPLLTAKDILGH